MGYGLWARLDQTRPFRTIWVELSRTIGPDKFASGRSNRASSASCGNTTARRPACQICLGVEDRQPLQPSTSHQRWVVRNRRPGLVFLFFVRHPNEEIQDDRRSTAAHNLPGQAVGKAVPHMQDRIFPNHRPRRICLRQICRGEFGVLRKHRPKHPRCVESA